MPPIPVVAKLATKQINNNVNMRDSGEVKEGKAHGLKNAVGGDFSSSMRVDAEKTQNLLVAHQ